MPIPNTDSHVIHLVGGPLDGLDIDAPTHASEMTFGDDASYGKGLHRISLAGECYLYSAYLSTRRPTFRHHKLPWDFGAP